MRENTDRKNSDYGHFSRSVYVSVIETASKFSKIFSLIHFSVTGLLKVYYNITTTQNRSSDADAQTVINYEIQRGTNDVQMEMQDGSQDHRAEADETGFDANEHEVEQTP